MDSSDSENLSDNISTKWEKTKINRKKRLSPFQIIILSFAAVILLGAFILMLPFSSAAGEVTSFSDALFTSTSSVCVTGLIVHDTAAYWSAFGQGVILILIQIGGMGVITAALFLMVISGKKINLMHRSTMQGAVSAPNMGGIVKLTLFIMKMIFLTEAVGALAMMPVFCSDFGLGRGIWMAVFHSISAFCNAGFDLMGVEAEFSSITGYSDNLVINTVIMLLIITGGLGFTTWNDIKTNKFRLYKYRMQSKVILCTTGILILLPAVYFFFFEFQDVEMGERILLSSFQSVTTRTAGFNTAELTAISEAGCFIMILLMVIGGSPGSTAGGMKTTSLAVLFSSMLSVVRHDGYAHLFGRKISEDIIRDAVALLIMYMTLFLAGGIIICRLEGLPLLTCLFETASAVGTVGLSLGITPGLCTASRIILIALMFFGRAGGLTMVYAVVSNMQKNFGKLPQEKIMIG